MPLYETVFIARQDLTPAQVEALSGQFESVIGDNGGNIEKREMWGLRSLAYKIKKNRKGHYILLNIDAPASALHEMERQMRISEDLLRYMTITVDEHESGPSIMMRNNETENSSQGGRPITPLTKNLKETSDDHISRATDKDNLEEVEK